MRTLLVFLHRQNNSKTYNSRRQSSLIGLFLVFLILLQFVATVYAQFPPFDLGKRYRLIPSQRYPTKPIKTPGPLRPILRSNYKLSSVGGMGGVAFEGVAKPVDGLQIDTLILGYDSMRPDGSRLTALINEKIYIISDLPDWQLVPIAKFADTPYIGCVTLFGELKPGVKPPPNTQYVVSYHPAFENTLLGLRLFQTDFYLLDPTVAGELPSLNGIYILGYGEAQPDSNIWQNAAYRLNQIIGAHENFDSYVICDYQRQVTFTVDSTRVLFDNYPYFYFWHRGEPTVESFEEDGEKIMIPDSHEVIHLEVLSDQVSSRIKLLHDANPAVFNSLVAIMRYSAFFRYCRQRNSQAWTTFLEKLATASIYPQVQTPSIVQER